MSLSTTMAFSGQMPMQLPQSTQNSSEMTALPLRTRMAWVGQVRMQAMCPRHFAGMTLWAWK